MDKAAQEERLEELSDLQRQWQELNKMDVEQVGAGWWVVGGGWWVLATPAPNPLILALPSLTMSIPTRSSPCPSISPPARP